MNENGYCPYCDTDLDGEDIIDMLVSQGKTLSSAHVYAMVYYSYRKHYTKINRTIFIYDKDSKKNIGSKCPDCGEEW